jgi:hypothetical protein
MTNPKPPIFPHPNTFTNHEGVRCSFTYEGEMAGRALLFKGKTDEGKPICIKFVRTYGKEVHLWFAAKGFAPPLIAYEKLPGGWYMVVMGLLDDSWVPFDIKTIANVERFKSRFQTVIAELHKENKVHGDIRETNVMVKDGGDGFMLVDYDWAGEQGEAKYPRHVNKAPALNRPDDVEDGKLILSEHDRWMLMNMFS